MKVFIKPFRQRVNIRNSPAAAERKSLTVSLLFGICIRFPDKKQVNATKLNLFSTDFSGLTLIYLFLQTQVSRNVFVFIKTKTCELSFCLNLYKSVSSPGLTVPKTSWNSSDLRTRLHCLYLQTQRTSGSGELMFDQFWMQQQTHLSDSFKMLLL